MTRLPAKPRPSDEAPDALEWQDVAIGLVLWLVLTVGAIMAHAAATGGKSYERHHRARRGCTVYAQRVVYPRAVECLRYGKEGRGLAAMNEQIAIELWRRPVYDGRTVEYTSLFKGNTYHVPCNGDVVTLEETVYTVHEVAWNFSERGLESVDVYLNEDGAL